MPPIKESDRDLNPRSQDYSESEIKKGPIQNDSKRNSQYNESVDKKLVDKVGFST